MGWAALPGPGTSTSFRLPLPESGRSASGEQQCKTWSARRRPYPVRHASKHVSRRTVVTYVSVSAPLAQPHPPNHTRLLVLAAPQFPLIPKLTRPQQHATPNPPDPQSPLSIKSPPTPSQSPRPPIPSIQSHPIPVSPPNPTPPNPLHPVSPDLQSPPPNT